MVTLTSTPRPARRVRAFSGTRNKLVPCGDCSARRADGLDERRVEQPVERLAQGIGARDAVQALERLVPADHPIVKPDDEQAIVERFEDVLVEGAQDDRARTP